MFWKNLFNKITKRNIRENTKVVSKIHPNFRHVQNLAARLNAMNCREFSPEDGNLVLNKWILLVDKVSAEEVYDESELPANKLEIINLSISVINSNNSPQLKSFIKNSIVFLANFQPGIGNTIKNPINDIIDNEYIDDTELESVARKINSISKEQERYNEIIKSCHEEMMFLIDLISKYNIKK